MRKYEDIDDYCKPEKAKPTIDLSELERRIENLYIRLDGLYDRKTYFLDHACQDNDFEKQAWITDGRIQELSCQINELKKLVNQY